VRTTRRELIHDAGKSFEDVLTSDRHSDTTLALHNAGIADALCGTEQVRETGERKATAAA
jgi:hypothetical protein